MLIHLVGLNKKDSKSKPKKAILLKKKITTNIVNVSRICKIEKLIYLSSIQVYDNFENKKIVNEKSRISTTHPYSKAHVLAEKIILSSNQIKNVKIVRASSIFGALSESQSKEFTDTILNNFSLELVKKNYINIRDPYRVRNFLPFSVLVKCIDDIINNKFKKKIKILNLGYKSLSLNNVLNIVSNRLNLIAKKQTNPIKIKNKKANKFKYVSIHKNYIFQWKIFNKEIDSLIKIFIKKSN